AGALITSAGGAVQVTGTGGNSIGASGANNIGVEVNYGMITAGGAGSVTVLGTGGGGGSGLQIWGSLDRLQFPDNIRFRNYFWRWQCPSYRDRRRRRLHRRQFWCLHWSWGTSNRGRHWKR